MWKKLKFEIGSESALLMHNGQLANPSNPIVKEISKFITKKRNMTVADNERVSKLEFMGSLYLNKDKRVIIPSTVLEACFAKAGAQIKQKAKVLSGLEVPESPLLIYEGPTDIEKLWNDSDFSLTTQVRIKQNKITRTRPKFDNWKASFIVQYNDSILNEEMVIDIVKGSGDVGIGDWRPKFGRFKVEKYSPV